MQVFELEEPVGWVRFPLREVDNRFVAFWSSLIPLHQPYDRKQSPACQPHPSRHHLQPPKRQRYPCSGNENILFVGTVGRGKRKHNHASRITGHRLQIQSSSGPSTIHIVGLSHVYPAQIMNRISALPISTSQIRNLVQALGVSSRLFLSSWVFWVTRSSSISKRWSNTA